MANDVVEGGTVIIPADNPHIDLLVELAEARGIADIRRFSTDEMAAASEPPHMVASKIYLHETCSCVSGCIGDAEVTFKVGTRAHHVSNSLAVLGAVQAAGADLALAALSLAEVEALSGRGRRHAGCCRWPLRVDR